jgi:hypothetical protein
MTQLLLSAEKFIMNTEFCPLENAYPSLDEYGTLFLDSVSPLPQEDVAPVATHDPASFILDKFRDHDIVLLGTKHSQTSIIYTIIELLPLLSDAGVTHIGLEIATDQQSKIDRFCRDGRELDDIEVFHVIDCPEYRDLLHAVRACSLQPVALDLPNSMWRSPYTRDEWMAQTIRSVFAQTANAKILVVVGNLHALKKVDWVSPCNQKSFINGYLEKYRPGVGVFSIVMECISTLEVESPLCAILPKTSCPFVVETSELDVELGILRLLAVKPMAPCDAADAVIVF